MSPRAHRKDLAAALLEEHAVRPELLERARREHQRSGRPLWALLTESGWCSDDAVFLALRRFSGAPVVTEQRLSGMRAPAELISIIPTALAAAEGVLPLERSADGRRVALAMVDPLAEVPAVHAALAREGVAEIHRFLVHRAVLLRCLPRLYGEAPAELPLSEQPTGLVRLPGSKGTAPSFRRERNDETIRLVNREGGRRSPLLSPPVRAVRRQVAITQPLAVVQPSPSPPPTVEIDPELRAEIARYEARKQAPPPRPEEALAQVARALAIALEARLRPPPPRLPELALLVQRAATTLGLPRPEDLGLLAQLTATERLLQLGAETPDEGRALGDAVRTLEMALLSQDEAMAERVRRLLSCAAAAHELQTTAMPDPALGGPLRARIGGGDIAEAVLQALQPVGPQVTAEDATPVLEVDPDPTSEIPIPAIGALPDTPSAPGCEFELTEVSPEGLAIYQAEDKEEK
ncbi:MAG: hypothetical protein RMK29_20795 [Myxococcales bacterium]|nr:hypothetical protein [Myxococcota bacterium]MDW8284151.1 hypothetical protein [Myxococcales bacterium]